MAVQERPLRFLFFLYHAGYLRHYAEPIRQLARDGHTIHLAFTVIEKDAGDRRLVEALAADYETITFGKAPRRSYIDGWRRTSTVVRGLVDLTRYIDPRYAGAVALKNRVGAKIKTLLVTGRVDPVSRWALSRLVDRLSRVTDPRTGRRMLNLLGAAELAIPTSRRVNRFMRGFAPDAVLATPVVEFASNQVDYLKSAQRLGIPTAICVASWDNLTNKGLLRFTPDRVLVWNEMQRKELEELHRVPPDRVVVTGAQKFDEWFERRVTRDSTAFKQRVGLEPVADYLLYVCSSTFIAPDEVSYVRRWLKSLRESGFSELEQIGVVVRPHPQNGGQWSGVDLHDFGDVVVWPPIGAQPDDGDARADFFDSLSHAAAVVGVNTSAMIEAAIVGKNVLTVLDPAFAATQEGTLHFHYLLRENGGFLRIARSLDDHTAQLREVLMAGDAESARVRAFVESFVRPHGLDVPAAALVADAMRELGRSQPQPRQRMSVRLYALRLALLLPTAMATVSTLLGALLQTLSRRRRSATSATPSPGSALVSNSSGATQTPG
jgi:hypothetical protein